MPTPMRLQRIADRIRQEFMEMIVKEEIHDPRVSGIMITDVKVDKELAYADIYVSAVEGIERSKEVLEGLEHARGFIRHELAQRIELRVFPRIRFHWDITPERADRIERLLHTLKQEAPIPPTEEKQDAE
jgi:ribosome-binding factor A